MKRPAFGESTSLAETQIVTPAKTHERGSTWITPLCIALVSRLGLWLLAYLCLASLEAGRSGTVGLPGNLFLAGWIRWDGPIYASIAQYGWHGPTPHPNDHNYHGFFPLYPLTIRALTYVIGDPYVSGWLISNVCFLIAAALLYWLVRDEFAQDDEHSAVCGLALPAALSRKRQQSANDIAHRALLLLCVFPFSFFYSAMYTESLFLMLTLAAFCCARRGWWITAGIFASLSGATRAVGIATGVALAVMAWQSRGRISRSLRIRQIISVLISFTGLLAFVIFIAIRRHDLFAVVTVHRIPGWGDMNSWAAMINTLHAWRESSFSNAAAGHLPLVATFNLLFIPIAIALCIICWRRLPSHYATWTTIVVLISMSKWVGYGRYTATMFPLFIVTAMLLTDKKIYHGLVYISTILLAWLTVLFVEQSWVA
jgi:Gpi18-like mannosyltransferase